MGNLAKIVAKNAESAQNIWYINYMIKKYVCLSSVSAYQTTTCNLLVDNLSYK